MYRHPLPAVLAILLGCTLFASPANAQKKKLQPTGTWKGSVADLTLQTLAPASGHLSDEKALARLWEAWKVEGNMPKVDFKNELILVATTRGSRLQISPVLDDNGNLAVLAVATRDLRDGFRYEILKVSREGVKTINGKQL
ncbi:MAG TPA: hypothetical protein VEL76_12645 [Gemmataceae bacterium]|nr:hypothetical protein [Gemmataceae bacterium]